MLARLAPEPLPHVWWGVTIESDEQAGRADRSSSGTRGWNRSVIEPVNTSRGARQRDGTASRPGCRVTAKPGPLVRGSPSRVWAGLPMARSRRAKAIA